MLRRPLVRVPRRAPRLSAAAGVVTAAAVLARVAPAWAYGEETGGFPSWSERVLVQWMNRARVEPATEMARCGAACGEAMCYTPQPPLVWDLSLAHAARFHADEMRLQGYFAHDSACTVVSNIATLYPGSCDGAASCACVGGTRACSPTCTTFSARVGLFGAGGTGEIIASGSDPDGAFYLWLFENSSSTTCGFSLANGHRYLILTSGGAVGTGVSGNSVGDFGGGTPRRIPSGSHYPRQAAQVDAWANWADAAAPQGAWVVADGACVPMMRARGTDTNGAWTAQVTGVGSGCHRYFFVFRDSTGAYVPYPDTGSLGIGPQGSCADWDATRPTWPTSCGGSGTPPPADAGVVDAGGVGDAAGVRDAGVTSGDAAGAADSGEPAGDAQADGAARADARRAGSDGGGGGGVEGGCGCVVPRGNGGARAAVWLAALGLAAASRRRRRGVR